MKSKNLNAPVKKNDDIEIRIDGMTQEGQGIGRVDGFAVFVPGALVGELVSVHIIKVASGYAVAKLIELIEPSQARCEPACAVFPRCGGCALQHMDYAAQLEMKRTVVKDALVRLGGFKDVFVEPVIGMDDPQRYRNKGSFPIGNKDGSVVTGFFATRTHDIVPVADCLVQNALGTKLVNTVCKWANKYGISAYDELSGTGLLRHVVTRTSPSGDIMAVIVATGELPYTRELTEELRNNIQGLTGLVLNVNPDNTNVILGSTFHTLWGMGRLIVNICSKVFQVSPESFLQVNYAQTEKLYGSVLDMLVLTGNEIVADVYCGIGTITLQLAQHAKKVFGIELVAQAVNDAEKNASANGIDNVEFICAPAEIALPKLVSDGFKPDAIVLDPPRKGCHPDALDAIARCGVNKIAYVSCNPATLARDCAILRDHGFEVIKVQPVDMFAHSAHIETAVLLTRTGT